MKTFSKFAAAAPAFALALALVSAPAADAAGGGGGRNRGGRGDMLKGQMAEKLGLTAEQKARMEEIRRADEGTMRAARENVAAKRRALDEAIEADANSGLVDQRVQELADAQEQMLRAMTTNRVKVREVLTPEQRQQIKTMRDGMRERRNERKGERLERTTT